MEKRPLRPIEENKSVSADIAFTDIRQIFHGHYQNALLEVGQYLLETFFDGNIDRLRHPPQPVHADSFFKLIEMLQGDRGSAPSKTWLYNSLGLMVDEHDYRDFQTYGKLLISQKIELFSIKYPVQKEALIIEVSENDYSVKELKKRKK